MAKVLKRRDAVVSRDAEIPGKDEAEILRKAPFSTLMVIRASV